jgi:DTW domain-containing protein YfiP
MMTKVQPQTLARKMENDIKPEISTEKIKSDQANDIQENPPLRSKSRRQICFRCQRPTPRACICSALPQEPIKLENTVIVVLQHPHELKQKNRSIPILELCMDQESLALCVGRMFGEEQLTSRIGTLLQPPNLPILLFPEAKSESEAISLSDAKKKVRDAKQKVQQKLPDGGKVVLIVIDATWKYAKEMHRANLQYELYPSNLLRVSMQPDDFPDNWSSGRFDIRTTPNTGDSSKSFMSTAECIAWAVSELGGETNHPELYPTLMKPLDLMVQKWNSFVQQPKIREKLPPKKKQKQK